MTKPVLDKAEVSIDFPDKVYMGSFARGSKVEARRGRRPVYQAAQDGRTEAGGGDAPALPPAGRYPRGMGRVARGRAAAMDADHRKTLKAALKRVEKALK